MGSPKQRLPKHPLLSAQRDCCTAAAWRTDEGPEAPTHKGAPARNRAGVWSAAPAREPGADSGRKVACTLPCAHPHIVFIPIEYSFRPPLSFIRRFLLQTHHENAGADSPCGARPQPLRKHKGPIWQEECVRCREAREDVSAGAGAGCRQDDEVKLLRSLYTYILRSIQHTATDSAPCGACRACNPRLRRCISHTCTAAAARPNRTPR